MNKRAKHILIGAVLLLDFQSFAALSPHVKRREADVRCLSSAATAAHVKAGVLWKVLGELGVNLQ
jgi:hypothetical protein